MLDPDPELVAHKAGGRLEAVRVLPRALRVRAGGPERPPLAAVESLQVDDLARHADGQPDPAREADGPSVADLVLVRPERRTRRDPKLHLCLRRVESFGPVEHEANGPTGAL